MKPKTKDEFTAAAAEELLRRWQKALRLDQWVFSVEVVNEIDGNTWGNISHNVQRQNAHINLLHPDSHFIDERTAGANLPAWYRWERTLVHELVHAVLMPITYQFEQGGSDELLEEQAVHNLADALMAMKYPHPTWTKPGTALGGNAPHPGIAWFAIEDIPQFSHVKFDDANGAVSQDWDSVANSGTCVGVPGYGPVGN